MNGIRKVLVFTLAGSILSAVLTASILTNKVTNVDDNFDLSTIDSAYADSTNSLFLKVDGIPASSTTFGHNDEIELLWYCFGFSSRTDIPGCNSEEGKNNFATSKFDGFHFIMADNKATPGLLFAYLNQTAIKTVTFSAVKGTMLSGLGNDYLVVT
jgi:type VI protein secretion system component Hcp